MKIYGLGEKKKKETITVVRAWLCYYSFLFFSFFPSKPNIFTNAIYSHLDLLFQNLNPSKNAIYSHLDFLFQNLNPSKVKTFIYI